MQDTIDFINQIVTLLNELPEKTDSYWERLIIWIIIAYLELKVYMIEIAYDFASQFIQSLGLSEAIQQAWATIPAPIASTFSYLRIPEAVNMLMSACLTRFLLGLLP